MDVIGGAAAARAIPHRVVGNQGKADGIRRSILTDMDDVIAIQMKQVGPEIQLIMFAHGEAPQARDKTAIPPSPFYGVYTCRLKISKGGGEPVFLVERAEERASDDIGADVVEM